MHLMHSDAPFMHLDTPDVLASVDATLRYEVIGDRHEVIDIARGTRYTTLNVIENNI